MPKALYFLLTECAVRKKSLITVALTKSEVQVSD